MALVGCPRIFLSLCVPNVYTVYREGQAKTFHIFVDIVPFDLPRTSPLTSTAYLRHRTSLDPITIVIMFDMSENHLNLPFLIK